MKEEDISVDVIDDNQPDSLASQRIPKCARCRCHGINNELKGHKEKCQFKDCECRLCLTVVERQKITAIRVAHLRHQRKVDKQRGANKYYSPYPPLTEEEDYVLSNYMDDEQTRRQRIYIQDRYRYLNGRPYSAPSFRHVNYEPQHDSGYGPYIDSYNSRLLAYNGRPHSRPCTYSCCKETKELKGEGAYAERQAQREYYGYSRTHQPARVKYADPVETRVKYADKVETRVKYADNVETRVKYADNVETRVKYANKEETNLLTSDDKDTKEEKYEHNNNNHHSNSDKRSQLAKETQRRDEFIKGKCWEVLTVMFPDFDVALIKYASDRAQYNIQLAVEYLLDMKKKLREGDGRSSAFATYKPSDQPTESCPCCYNKLIPKPAVKVERSNDVVVKIQPPQGIYRKTEC